MRAIIPYLLSLLAAGAVACGSSDDPTDGTGDGTGDGTTDGPGDGTGTTAHALRSTVRPARELASGGARLRGGFVRMDVQVGRSLAHAPMRVNRVVARPAAAVMP
jgi:hypothetical protein